MKKFRTFNRRGDIPTTILVLGVFIVCTLTLLNFYLVGLRDNNSFESAVLVKEVSRIADEINFYELLGKDASSLSGNSRVIIEKDFNITKEFKEGVYSIEGIIFDKKFGFIKGDQLVMVEYSFPS